MIVGLPAEIKVKEFRVGMTPAGVHALAEAGHKVLVQKGAGLGSMIADEEYEAAGGCLVETAAEAWQADMIVKVKEPLAAEYGFFRPGQIIYTYLHLAAEKALTQALLEKKAVGIAYETVQLENGSLPLLAPMSEVAGRMAVQVGAQMLTKNSGGMGLLLGGTAGVPPAHVVIVGAGTVGLSAAKVAVGMGARVTVVDSSINRLRYINDVFGQAIETAYSNAFTLAAKVKEADLLIGSVLIPGALTPKLVTEAMVKTMKKGAAIVDVAIDQGGCVETTARHGATYHDNPTFEEYGVIHYSVGNMPGAVARTSTYALTNATMPYMLALAGKGWKKACQEDKALSFGINTCNGQVFYKGVADALGLELHSLEEILS